MGVCCSKKKSPLLENDFEGRNSLSLNKNKNKGKDKSKHTQETNSTTISAIHSNTLPPTLSLIVQNHPSRVEHIRSLIIAPPAEDLLVKFWVQKRGHLVRSWTKRFFVLQKSEIKYYTQEIPEPPFGKYLKGQVSLCGAVCISSESEDFREINVEIFGSLGEKDLFFSVENTEKGKVCNNFFS
jgi:hypothetical protein